MAEIATPSDPSCHNVFVERAGYGPPTPPEVPGAAGEPKFDPEFDPDRRDPVPPLAPMSEPGSDPGAMS